jgi:hypothetical protein
MQVRGCRALGVARDVVVEHLLGLLSLRVMGIETLNNAARAAGFAMAASDEPYEEARREAPVETQVDERIWQSQALVAAPSAEERHHKGEWLRSMLGLVWGRAPASPA